jgi:hypothetical protein
LQIGHLFHGTSLEPAELGWPVAQGVQVHAQQAQLSIDFVHQLVQVSMLDAVCHELRELMQNAVCPQQVVVVGT